MDDKGAKFLNKQGGLMEGDIYAHLTYFCFKKHTGFSVVIVICIVMSVFLTTFVGYHLELAMNNSTTNENYKYP